MATQKKIETIAANKKPGCYGHSTKYASINYIALLGNTVYPRSQLLGLFLFYIALNISFSQSNPNRLDPDDYHFEVVDLPRIGTNINIESIVQDSEGYLWLATGKGLLRYDGYRTEQFLHNPLDSTSISSDDVSSLYLDPGLGVLWVGTYNNGLNRMDLSSELFTRFLPSRKIWALTMDTQGYVWAGTESDGLYRLDSKRDSIRHFSPIPGNSTSLSQPCVISLLIDSAEKLWVSTGSLIDVCPEGGLHRYLPESESFIRYRHQSNNPNSLPSGPISAIIEDTKQRFWVGTDRGLVRWMDNQSETFMTIPLESSMRTSSGFTVFSLLQDREQRLWIGTGHGVHYYDPLTNRQIRFEMETGESPLPHNTIWRMFQSRESVYWIGTGRRGNKLLKFFRKPAAIHYHQPPGASGARAFLEDKEQDKVWIGTDSALVLYDLENGILKNYPYHSSSLCGLPENHLRAMEQDYRGQIWLAASDPKGSPELCCFDPSTEKSFLYRLLPNDSTGHAGFQISDILEDQNRRLWVTTEGGGVYSHDPTNKSFVRLTPEGDGSALDYVLDLYEDRQENLWMVTQVPEQKLSLIRFVPDQGTFERINIPTGSSYGGIAQDEHGYLWLAIDKSLIRLDPKTNNLHTFNSDNSTLPDEPLGSLVVDDQGQLWFRAYVFDLYRYNPAIGTVSYHARVEEATGSTLGLSDRNLKMSDGAIVIGSLKGGFISVNPDRLKTLTSEELQIVDIKILGGKSSMSGAGAELQLGSLRRNEKLSLSYDQNSFALDFFIADYRDPASRIFEFMLENYDDSWRKTGPVPQAVYHRVPPGKYMLRVRTTSVAGERVPEKSIQIQIFSAWWQSWWAKVLFGLFGLSLMGGVYRWRISQMTQRQKELEHLVSIRTSEVLAQQKRSDQLLLNILPAEVAKELKATGKTQPVHFDEVSILFSDFKEFTNIVASIPGKKLVSELDDIFQHFDDIMDEIGLEKIQTIGDAYVAAGGLPKKDSEHAIKCVKAGKRMIEYLTERNSDNAIKWKVRIGIHSGPIIAGVVGKKKCSYDLFGDTVNIAARIESTSEEGRINVSAYTYDLIKDHFTCEYRGKINAKGKGDLDMYFVN